MPLQVNWYPIGLKTSTGSMVVMQSSYRTVQNHGPTPHRPAMAKRHIAHPVLQRFGAQLRSIHDQRGLTRDQLGELLETDPKNIYRLESGTENISLVRASRVAAVLQVSLGELLDGTAAALREWEVELKSLGWPTSGHLPAREPEHRRAQASRQTLPVLDLAPVVTGGPARSAPRILGTARAPAGRRIKSTTSFLGRISGDAMAPRIPHGAWCLFDRHRIAGDLLGADVLVGEREPGGLLTWAIRRVQQISIGPDQKRFITVCGQSPTDLPRQLELPGSDDSHVVAVLIEIIGCGRAGLCETV